MSDELDGQAAMVVDLIRAHKPDGSLTIDRDQAVGAVLQLIRTAHAMGVVAGTLDTGKAMSLAVDAAFGGRQ